jgi:hypothetical protein
MIDPEEAVIVNALVRQALVSAQEVMGENGLNAVLYSVGLERFISTASFQYGVQEPAIFQEKAELEIVRRLPVLVSWRRMLDLVADTLQEGGGEASVHTLDMDLSLVDHSSAPTLNHTYTESICFVTLGLIQSALFGCRPGSRHGRNCLQGSRCPCL